MCAPCCRATPLPSLVSVELLLLLLLRSGECRAAAAKLQAGMAAWPAPLVALAPLCPLNLLPLHLFTNLSCPLLMPPSPAAVRVLKLLLERLGADFSHPGGLAAVAGPAIMLVGAAVCRHWCSPPWACCSVLAAAPAWQAEWLTFSAAQPASAASACLLTLSPACLPACLQVGDAASRPELREMRPSILAAAALLACRRSAGALLLV